MSVVAVMSGCSTTTESGTDAAGVTTDGAANTSGTTTTSGTIVDTTTVLPTSIAPTTSTTSTTTTSSTTTSTTSTVPPPLGGFACTPAGQAPPIWEVRPPSGLPSPELPPGWVTASIGRSVQGRSIEALVHPADSPRRRVVVIGGIHGNEPVTPPAVRGLLDAAVADDVEVWLVPVVNADGSAAGLRCNANGVDLNRNFAWEWDPVDGGPGPMSEPETLAVSRLVDSLRPDAVVWVHQPLGYVSAVGATDSRLEDAWGAAAGLPVRPDVTQHGGGESWSALVVGVPSLLIEIDGWDATPEMVASQRAGFEAMLAVLG